jgi:hypothetical protein
MNRQDTSLKQTQSRRQGADATSGQSARKLRTLLLQSKVPNALPPSCRSAKGRNVPKLTTPLLLVAA